MVNVDFNVYGTAGRLKAAYGANIDRVEIEFEGGRICLFGVDSAEQVAKAINAAYAPRRRMVKGDLYAGTEARS